MKRVFFQNGPRRAPSLSDSRPITTSDALILHGKCKIEDSHCPRGRRLSAQSFFDGISDAIIKRHDPPILRLFPLLWHSG